MYEGPVVMDIWVEVVEVGVICKEALVADALAEDVGEPPVVAADVELVTDVVVKEDVLGTEKPVKTP